MYNHRVYALYGKSKTVGIILVLYLTAELGVALWIYGTPGAHGKCRSPNQSRFLYDMSIGIALPLPPPVANNANFHGK